MKSKNQSNNSYIGSDLFKSFIEQNPVSIQIHSLDGRLIDSNPAFAKIYALSNEALSELYEKYNLLEDEQAVKIGVMPDIKRTFAGETVAFPEYEYNGIDTLITLDIDKPVSRKCWVKTQGFPIKNDEGEITHAAFISEDITASKIAEKELQESRLFTDNLIQSANMMIVGIDKEGKVNIFNPAAERISGYSYDEIKDKDWFSTLVPIEKYPEVHKEFNRLMEGGTPKLFENPILTKNGEERIISWTNNEIIKDNEAAGLICFGTDITDQKKAEEELKRIFNLSSDLIGIAGFDGIFKQLNPAWETTLGYSFTELMSKPFVDFVHPDDVQKTTTEVNKLTVGQKTIDFENRYFHKDGSVRHISWTATPMVSEKNIYCIGRDITERKKNEDALIESEERFRNLMEQSPLSIQICDKDGNFVDGNKAWKQLWNISEEDIPYVKANYNILKDEEVKKRGILPLIEKAYTGEAVQVPDFFYESAGEMDAMGLAKEKAKAVWLRIKLYPVFDEAGDVKHVISIEEDISESKLAEEKLKQSEKDFRDLVEQNPLYIQAYSPEGNLINLNKSYADLLNLSKEMELLLYKSYNVLRDPQAAEQGLKPGLKKVFAGETFHFLEYQFDVERGQKALGMNPKGPSKIWLKTTGFPIKDENGAIKQVVFLSQNVSQRHKAEEQILQYQQRLKDLALELTYAEEKQRKQIATDLHDDVGQLLASARLQIAAMSKDMDKEDIFGKMKGVSHGLLEAIQSTRNAIFELSPPQLNEIGLVAALSDWMEEEVEAKHGIKTILLGKDQIYALSEQVRYLLFRCVREMLINVIKHAKATQLSLNIFEENNVLYIAVQDDGTGFDYRPDIQGTKSAGFGLFSIHERIKNIGGSIDVDTAPGKGTIITLNLPFNK